MIKQPPDKLPDGWFTEEWSDPSRAKWWNENVHEPHVGTEGIWWPRIIREGTARRWLCWVCHDLGSTGERSYTSFQALAKTIKDDHATCLFKHINSSRHKANITLLSLANEQDRAKT